jgi:CheY-like chemotaxis protein
MPDMDGIELTREIRRHDQGKTKVLLLTGYSFDDAAGKARESGVDALLNKPLFTDTLLREIQNVIHKRSPAVAEADAAQAGAEGSTYASILAGRRILLAEDIDINADILIDLLHMEKMEGDHALNGQICVEMFANSQPGYYDAILMDVRMPVMDGLTASKAIRELDRPDAKAIPIIAMTANAFDEDVQRSLQAGMNAHLSKPVEPERLYETLGKLIRQKGQ